MSTLLLHTKLCIPPAPRTQMSRPHLVQRLDQLQDPGCRLALIAAPPGFGKSTLLGEWVTRTDLAAAWISLDEADNDPVRFWDYVVAALQTLYSGLGEQFLALSHEPNPLPVETRLTLLINEIGTERKPFVLILDDYHCIDSKEIHQAVAFLLDRMPPAMHLVIASRTDPPLPLARLRARNQLVELRGADLRFSTDETSALLERITGMQLDAQESAGLEARIEGWAAGVQLAALALQGRTDSVEFLKTFTGDHRYILDYLVDEVLDRQPEPVRQFLLETSILHRLHGPLCAAVTGQTDSQLILERLERENLFLIALDGQRQWYRYHQLFADFLRNRLQQSAPVHTPELHRRASAWFQQNGLVFEAVNHALAAQDFERAADLIEQTAEQLIWRRPELHTLLHWLDVLPAGVFADRPRLCLYHAWTLYLTNQMAGAEQRVQEAERGLGRGAAADDRLASGMVATLYSTLTGIRQRFAEAETYSRQALQRLPEGAISWRCIAAINLGISLAATGAVDEAVAVLSYAMELSQEIGSAFAMLSAFWHLASLYAAQLRLREAEETCQLLLHLLKNPDLQRFPVDGYIALLLGEIALERNELDTAAQFLEQSAEQINPEGFPMALLRSYIALARVGFAQNDPPAGDESIRQAEQLVIAHHLQGRSSPLSVYRTHFWIHQGNWAAATRWVEENHLTIDDEFGYHREPYYLTLARLLLARARYDPAGPYLSDALHLLWRMARRAEESGRTGSLVRALALLALALDVQWNGAAAVETLARALSLTATERCVRTFVDEGAPMAALLSRVLDLQRRGQLVGPHHIAPDYVITLLAALGTASSPRKAQGLIEPLSERELEVLRLLAEDRSSNEIATRLVIAVGTARKHIKNVYGKLDVHSRLEAVRRAQDLDLL